MKVYQIKNRAQVPVIDWVSLGLEVTRNITDIVKTAQPTERERLLRREINRVADMARAEHMANKIVLRDINAKLAACRRGLRIARKQGLDTSKLLANMQSILDLIGK